MWGLRSTRTYAIGLAAAAFVVCSVLPVAYMLTAAAIGAGVGSSSDAAWNALWLDARQRALLWNTTIIGVGTALASTLIGAPLGVALARIDLPLKAMWRLLLTVPLALPPYVVALAWTYLGGSTGVAARVTGRDLFSAWTYSLPGAIFVLSVVLFPLSMLAAEVAVRRVDSRLEEAALLVAPAGRVLRRITLPLAAPPIWAAGLIIFVLAISEFGVPALLRVRVFTTEVFTAFAALYDFRRATVLTIPLLVLSAIVAIAAARILGERLVTTRRGSRNTQTIRLDGWKGRASTGAAVVVALTVVLPMLVLLAESFASGPDIGPLRGSLDAITNSLILAAVSACAVVGVAFWIGYARARFAPPRAGRFVDALLLALFAAPSTIVGIGLIGVWNRSGPVGALYGTDAMLVIAPVARFVPVAALVIGASVRQLPVSHEEAAAVSGAGWLRTIRRIVLPQVALGLLAAWIVTFILTFGELGASILVAPPGESTLPIRVYTLIANAPSSHVAALALLQAGVVICPLVILAFALVRREAR